METRFDWGIVDVHMDVQHAVITDVVIFSDALNVELIERLKETLTDIRYDRNEVKAKLAKLSKTHSDLATQIDEVSEWLISEMET